MANFCPNCGGKVNPEDKFCKSCGTKIATPVETPKPAPVQMPTPVEIPQKPARPGFAYRITNFLGLLMGIGIVILVLYSLGCAMGMFPNTEDRMCQSISQAFKGGGGAPVYGAPCKSDGEKGIYGTDGQCYTCSKGTAVTTPTGNCSSPLAGVYCCGGGTSGSGGGQVSIGCQHCSPGYC